MKKCAADKVRNFVLAGHAGAGKTTLADLMLLKAGVITRKSSVDQGTSVSDFRTEEHDRKSSIFTSSLNCPWKDGHFFYTDTPGYPDFCGEVISAIKVADVCVLVIDASLGIGPGTIRAYKQARDNKIPRAIFINGCDRDQADYDATLAAVRESYGATKCVPFTIPIGAKADFSGVASILSAAPDASVADAIGEHKMALTESVAETDEALMEKYFEEGELSEDDLQQGIVKAIVDGSLVPVFAGSAEKDLGIAEFMDAILACFPSPLQGIPVALEEGELDRTSETTVAYAFRSVTDPFIGQLTFLRIYSGILSSDNEYINVTSSGKERVNNMMTVNGKEQEAITKAGPGDIVAIAKLKGTGTGDVLSSSSDNIAFPPIVYPQPTMSYAVFAASKGDEDKIGTGLHRLAAEDATFTTDRNDETHQTVINGMGDQHLHVMISRLKTEFKVEVNLETPKVPYRETITSAGSAHYRHKKQTGGHGQFAEVHLRLEPFADGEFEFANEVVGGNIPKNYIPAVEKGVIETMQAGPLAGCKVINVRAVVFDGKFHAVDSSEMAFKIAARGAFRAAMKEAKANLLEPIMILKIMFPEEYMGDISGDLNSRRGRILGMDVEEGMQVLNAEVPLAETFVYSTQLRSLTHGRGSFEMTFDRYDPVPSQLASQIQAEAQTEEDED